MFGFLKELSNKMYKSDLQDFMNETAVKKERFVLHHSKDTYTFFFYSFGLRVYAGRFVRTDV